MSVMSWFLELVSTISMLMIYYFLGNEHIWKSAQKETSYNIFWVFAFDATLNNIIIPLTYILKLDANRYKIADDGWTQGLGSLLGLQKKEQSNSPDLELAQGQVPPPIRTISQNVGERQGMNQGQSEDNVPYVNLIDPDNELMPFAAPRWNGRCEVLASSPPTEDNINGGQPLLNLDELLASITDYANGLASQNNSGELPLPSWLADTEDASSDEDTGFGLLELFDDAV